MFIIVINVVIVIVAVVVIVVVFITIVVMHRRHRRVHRQTDKSRAGRLTGGMGMSDRSDGATEAIFFRGHTKIGTIELSIVVRGLSISDKV